MPVEHITPAAFRFGETADPNLQAPIEHAGDSGSHPVGVNGVGGMATPKGQPEPLVTGELDDFLRSRDSGSVDVPKPDGGAANAFGSGLARRITLDVKLGAPVLARWPRMKAHPFIVVRFRDQLAVDSDGAQVNEPAQRPCLQQTVDERAIARVRRSECHPTIRWRS